MERSLATWRNDPRAKARPIPTARATDSTQEVRLLPRGAREGFWDRRGPGLAGLGVVVLVALVLVALGLAGAFSGAAPGPTPSGSSSGVPSPSGTGPSPTPTPTPTPTPSASASESPSIGPSPSPSLTPAPPTATPPRTPVPTPVPVVDFGAASQQLANLLTAIDTAQRLGNIASADAADLVRLTDPIAAAIAAADATTARQGVSQLAGEVDAMLADGRLRNNQELRQTVVNLAHSLGLSL